MTWYVLLIARDRRERLAELVVSNRNREWSRGHGGTEFGAGHYPVMVVLHVGLLVGCLVEPLVMQPAVHPRTRLADARRSWWPRRCCAGGASPRLARNGTPASSSSRMLPRVTGGPYRFLPHPNYVAVVLEGIALPLVHSAWITAHGVHGAQCGAAAHPDQGRERRAGEPDVIDLLVAGGGPAGLATALYGARAGLEVVVVERREGVLDKACGEGMMPHTLAHVDRLGIVPKGRPLRGITYLAGVSPGRRDVPRRRGTGRAQDRAARRAAGRRRGGRRAVRPRRRRRGHAGRRRRCGPRDCVPATSPRPTDCTRRSVDRSAWSCRAVGRGGGGSAGTCRSRRGRTTSRCTGPAAPRRT